jgi:hypothetical protein
MTPIRMLNKRGIVVNNIPTVSFGSRLNDNHILTLLSNNTIKFEDLNHQNPKIIQYLNQFNQSLH